MKTARKGCGGSNDEVSPDPDVIWFYDENREWGEFSNFYGKKQDRRFSLRLDGKEWLTTEHYFQAQKFLGPNASAAGKKYAQLIAKQNTPNKAAVLARQRTGGGYKWRTDLNPIITKYLDKGVELREDWDEVCDQIMEKAVYAKFSQNGFLKDKLLETITTASQDDDQEEDEEKPDAAQRNGKKRKGGRDLAKRYKCKKQKVGIAGKTLVEHTSRDCYWADAGDGSGANMLGKILMKVRARLLEERHEKKKPN